MMLAVMIGLAAAVGVAEAAMPVADAERGFAALAQRDGQCTAYRATATADAIMFVPGNVKAQDWLQGRADTWMWDGREFDEVLRQDTP